jgi:hypothetical protein
MTEVVEEEGIGHTESIRTAGIAPREQVVSQAMVVNFEDRTITPGPGQ